ncbi:MULTISPECIES: hypothetical protein [unclassified Streptomyces]|uniref:hypothetical protein n=1 Tax=unclassified Streptomyces TaxID=2593676 RepID=UPI0022500B46|nr:MULTISPECIES: hypothetical protein [unclassified Streptomyces]MCX4525368.1 hypothetical protein [Streptomyces sp. NBC_01551]MCX4544160.1 hypothetical protein [Streptomyces sp. NBC_01565]
MRRLRGLIVPFLTLPVLALAGCGGAGQVRTAPSAPASPSPVSPSPDPAPASSPPPAPSPGSTRNRLCVPTTGMTTADRLAYFKDLSDSDHGASPAFFMTDSGVYLLAKETQRPCEAVRFQLSWFRVEMTRAGAGSTARYSFTYAPIESTTLSAGPRDGRVVGSVPPPPKGCSGTLSVVYVGEEITEEDLPEGLNMPSASSTLDWTLVELDAERVLSAVFKPPAGASSC